MADKYAIDLSAGDDLQDEEMAETQEVTIRRKGRGFQSEDQRGDGVHGSSFEKLRANDDNSSGNAMRSIEGWIVLITGVHEEATEEDIQEHFGEFGPIKNVHLNLDRRTGYVKGYALIEYEEHSQAKAAIEAMNGRAILEQTVNCDFAFVKPTVNDDRGRRGFSTRNNRGGYGGRRSGRSRSPGRR
ncbi:MAG: RNA-binding domain-containing protein [Benniella sp.]|nr:MAG: RNA-binding domain-containing protein [Benniella sp.]